MVLVSLQAEFCERKMDMAVRIGGKTSPHRWDEHAAFVDGLVAEGFIQAGDPLDEERGGLLVVMAWDEVEEREQLRPDPWYAHDSLALV